MNAIDRVIAVAEGETGYLEKKSNNDLDDKTANAGSSNYTKYNRDMKAWAGSAGINDQWCQNFVDWCFVTAFGIDGARKLLYKFTNYTPTGSNAFKKRGRYIERGKGRPQRGDVIYFYSSAKGRIGHVGIVYKVGGSTVYTIEGNTSGASSLVTNGGGVRKKSYSLTSTYIDGYGRVDYDALQDMAPLRLGDRVLKNGDEGEDVKAMQQLLIALGYDCGSYGADGEFGDCTEMALRAAQSAAGISEDGIFTAVVKTALEALWPAQEPETGTGRARYVQIEAGKRCYVRDAPGTEGRILGVARGGEKLNYQGQTFENGWHLVEYDGKNACVSGKYGRLVA